MRRRAAAISLALVLSGGACARLGPPPGGPEDKLSPQLLGTVPESLGRYPGWHRDVEFRFDEVISEGGSPNLGTGSGDLEKLVLLSPDTGVPRVQWKRSRITVRPRDGWRPGVVYRIELLPGLADLRRNTRDSTTVVTFTTGDTLPTDTLEGVALDWAAGRVARGALVEAVRQPDSLVYRTLADSSGRYLLGPIPRGRYTVYAAVDANHNLRRDRREGYDSTGVAAGDRAVPPLWLVPRDTLGPRIQTAQVSDSLTASLTFNQPLDPAQPPGSLQIRVFRQSDSAPVVVLSLLPPAVDDSLQRLRRTAADSLKPGADSAAPEKRAPRAPAPAGALPAPGRERRGAGAADSLLRARPVLSDRLVLRVETPFTANTRYTVEIIGVRSVAGVAADAKAMLAVGKTVPGDRRQGGGQGRQGDQQEAPPRPKP